MLVILFLSFTHVQMFLSLCVFQILWKAFVALACDERATVLLSDPGPERKNLVDLTPAVTGFLVLIDGTRDCMRAGNCR
jgi:hypothetical protein